MGKLSGPKKKGTGPVTRSTLRAVPATGPLKPCPRYAFTFTEIVVTLAVIGVLGVVIMQCLVTSMRERDRLTARQTAVELAANVLEAARAQPWEKLDKNWAAAQSIPAETEGLLPDGKILVTVDAPVGSPWWTRRVTVDVRWQSDPPGMQQSVQLAGFFSARAAKKQGEQP